MNKILLPLLVVVLIFVASSNSIAATLSVLPGTSIQTKINQAQSGDIVAIFGGTYNEDITINKAIRLVEVSGQQVNITGNIAFTGITNAPIFEGFQVGSGGRGITISDTTGLVLRNIVAADFVNIGGASSVEILSSQIGGGSTTSGTSTTRIKACQIFGAIIMSGSSGEIIDSTCWRIGHYVGTLNIYKCSLSDYIDTGTGAQKTVVFRTTLKDAHMRSKKVWFGYCDATSFNYYDADGGKVVIVGCKVDRQSVSNPGMFVNASNSSFLIANNQFTRMGGDGIYIDGSSNTGIIANNYISMWHHTAINTVRSAGFRIFSNLIGSTYNGISAPFGTIARNNLYYDSLWGGAYEPGGVVAEGTLRTDPKFVAGQAPTLAADSPCINAGVDDPIYNNRDGTRNTIGPSGGTLYDPDARTTENPVVISFDLGPEQVLEGEATEILLSNGQAVSQP